MAPLKRILVLGAYGTGNWGDELILRALSSLLRSAYPQAELRAFSYDPRLTADASGLSTVPIEAYRPLRAVFGHLGRARWRAAAATAREWREADRALEWADLLVLGGGNLLVDDDCYFLEHFTGQVVARAARRNVPVAVIGVGFGPVRTARGRDLLRRLAQDWACTLAVREAAARQALEQAGARRVHLIADPVLLRPPEPVAARRARPAYGISARPLPWKAEAASVVGAAVRSLRARGDVIGLPLHPGPDEGVLRSALAAEEIADGRALPPLVSALASCSLVAGMRLHSLILAAAYAIPFVALAYHDKVLEFVEAVGSKDVVDLRRTLDPRVIDGAIAAAAAAGEERRRHLRATVAAIRDDGLRALAAALEDVPFERPAEGFTMPAGGRQPERVGGRRVPR